MAAFVLSAEGVLLRASGSCRKICKTEEGRCALNDNADKETDKDATLCSVGGVNCHRRRGDRFIEHWLESSETYTGFRCKLIRLARVITRQLKTDILAGVFVGVEMSEKILRREAVKTQRGRSLSVRL